MSIPLLMVIFNDYYLARLAAGVTAAAAVVVTVAEAWPTTDAAVETPEQEQRRK